MNIPEDFPEFIVPGFEDEMASLRALYWLHYPGSGPKATLWDEWLATPGLWPATDHENLSQRMRNDWRRALSNRIFDTDGYVATHQHPSIAHQLGWPFPFWNQGYGGYGWHFSFQGTVGPPWRQDHLSSTEGWNLEGLSDEGMTEEGWVLKVEDAVATLTTPEMVLDSYQAHYIQFRWKAEGLIEANPYIEWNTADNPEFGPDRRVYFAPAGPDNFLYSMVPMWHHPEWDGPIKQVRVGFGNQQTGATITINSLFSQYDTRHNVNNLVYIRGCAHTFWWTRDLEFLRKNINRMRTSLRYAMTELEGFERNAIFTPYPGHDGRSGVVYDDEGNKVIRPGVGIGNNYWDLIPFGGLDTYATIRYYEALRIMTRIEREILMNPHWDVPIGPLALDPEMLEYHAQAVRATGNRLFWNEETGRFVACINADEQRPDYGFTFLNNEALYYEFATPDNGKLILDWLSGERIVEGDTSQGEDIYFWRFAPRATTKRNIDHYGWYWSAPEAIPWGGQVQDGGAVLGFSYHDLMGRLKYSSATNTWNRLKEIIEWFDEVQEAGGYRQYYDGSREGSLQGGGTAGGLGLDQEFFESVMVPQVMLSGFMGFQPTGQGFIINPRLPAAWPSLTINQIRFHDLVLTITARGSTIEIMKEGHATRPVFVNLPAARWEVAYLTDEDTEPVFQPLELRPIDAAAQIDWQDARGVRLRAIR